jgi:hypothetical protein
MLSDEKRSADPVMIQGAAGMSYADELAYELWRAPRILTTACLATFGFFLLWAVLQFVAYLPMSWDNAIEQPGATAQGFFQFVFYYSLDWLPFSLPLFFYLRQVTWLRYRIGLARSGITYQVTATGIVSWYDKGFAITVPWALTNSVARTRRLLLLRRGWISWWYLPWNAFSAADRERLWTYAQQRVAETNDVPARS